MGAVVAILAVVTVLLVVVVVSLLRSHADILRALHDAGISVEEGRTGSAGTAPPAVPEEGRALGTEALDILGESPTGDAMSVSLEAAPRTLLAFLSAGCLTCRDLWTTIDEDGLPGLNGLGARLVVVAKSPSEESPGAIADLQPAGAPTVMSSAAWSHFSVPVAPYFVLVDGRSRRVIGEGAGRSWSQVRRMLEQAMADGIGVGDENDGMPRPSRRAFLSGREREARADRALADSGIGPGHPSIYPDVDARSEDDDG